MSNQVKSNEQETLELDLNELCYQSVLSICRVDLQCHTLLFVILSVINKRRRLKGPSTPRTRTTAIILNTSFLRVKPKRSETNSLVPEKLKWHRQALLALKLSEVTFGWFARDLEAAAASFLGDVHSEIVIFLFKIFHLCRVPLNCLGPSDIHTYINASKQIFQVFRIFKQTL